MITLVKEEYPQPKVTLIPLHLYNRRRNPAPHPVSPRSWTGTIDSRRSSASRRSQDSNQSSDSRSSRSSRNSKRRLRRKEREMGRIAIYKEIRSKLKLSPLIEPTYLLDRKRADGVTRGKWGRGRNYLIQKLKLYSDLTEESDKF